AALITLAAVMANPEAARVAGPGAFKKFSAKEREAVTALTALKFKVSPDSTADGHPALHGIALKVELTPEAVRLLQQLDSLAWLDLYDPVIKEGALAQLKGLPNLRRLRIELSDSATPAPWLKDVRELSNVRSLRLRLDALTDVILAEFAGMKNLEELLLPSADEVTD